MAYDENASIDTLARIATANDPVVEIEKGLLSAASNRPQQPEQANQNPQAMLAQTAMSRMKQLQEQQSAYPAQRQSALEAYQSSLRQNQMGDIPPTMVGFYDYLNNVGRVPSNVAAIRGVAAGGRALADMQARLVKGDILASGQGYKDVLDQDKGDIQELAALGRLSGAGAKSGQPTVRMDKDGNMVVFDPLTQTSKIVHSSQRGEYQRIWSKAYEKAVSEQMDNPEQYAHSVAANVLGTSAPGASTLGAPVGVTTQGTPMSPSIQYQNKPEQKRKEEFATGLEKGAIKDYEENIKPQAAIADSMLNTIGMLKQIPRTQDAFAPWREKLGAGLQAIGADGSMVREAENLQQVRPLLTKIANDRLMAAKGVQTEGDAQRAYNEFIKITDTQKAADFMYAWTEELANRNKFRKSVWEDSAQAEGTMSKAGKAWENTDYSKATPVAILNGKPWTYTAWRDAFVKSNPNVPLNEVIDVWNKLARGGK